jgi:CRP/FNR family transcriptional regulator, cyclic AMP receptor protein
VTQSPLEILRSVPILSNVPPADLTALAHASRERSYSAGQVILRQDAPGDAMYVVIEGRVKVVLIGEDGREVILSVLGAGAVFGEMSLLDDAPRSAHVVAMTPCRVMTLYRGSFHERLRASPDLCLAMLAALSSRLRAADDRIRALSLLDVNGRVAHLLLQQSAEAGGDVVPRRLTHQTMADLIGASRETVSRTLRHLVERDVIAIGRRQVTILDRAALEAAVRPA